MKQRRSFLAYLLLIAALLLLAVAVRLSDPQALARLRHVTFDTYQQVFPRSRDPQAPIAVVTIDDASLRAHGQWPWPRTLLAELVKRLDQAGAIVIGLDVVFPEPDRLSPEQVAQLWQKTGDGGLTALLAGRLPHDDLFAAEIEKAQVVLGFIGTNADAGRLPQSKTAIIYKGHRPHDFVVSFPKAITSLPKLQQKAAGAGALNWLPQHDQIVRKLPMLTRIGDRLYPALSLELLRLAQGADSLVVRSSDADGSASSGQETGLVDIEVGGLTIPVSGDGTIWLRPRLAHEDDFIPAHEVLANKVPLERLHRRIVLIGAHSAGLGDIQATALEQAVPGVLLHAQAMEQIIAGDFLFRPDYILGLELSFMVLSGILLALAIIKLDAKLSAAFAALVILATLFIGWYAFLKQGLLIDSVYPFIVLTTVYMLGTFLRHRHAELERAMIRSAFSHYLAPQYVARLMKNPDELTLGGEQRDISVMFCDVRGFTGLSENMDASELNGFINRLFSPLSRTITDHEGTIDKFIGDAVMAFWNAPLDIEGHPAKAVTAALAMLENVQKLNRELKAEHDENGGRAGLAAAAPRVVRIGIGISKGPCCVGNLGSNERFDYSAIGDSVNVASRIESLTKTYGVDVLVTEAVASSAPDYAFVEVDEIQVKGRNEALRIFALIGGADLRLSDSFRQFSQKHEAMLAAYRAGNRDLAREGLAACKGLAPNGLEGVYVIYESRLLTAVA